MFYPSFQVLVFWVATLFYVNSNKKHNKNNSCKRVGTRSQKTWFLAKDARELQNLKFTFSVII